MKLNTFRPDLTASIIDHGHQNTAELMGAIADIILIVI